MTKSLRCPSFFYLLPSAGVLALLLPTGAAAASGGKVDICHNNANSYNIINISTNAVAAHFANHADSYASTYYPDADGDGFGDPSGITRRCQAAGYVTNKTDCNDSSAASNPGNTEIVYDGIDNDCNAGTRDDDLDADGFPLASDCDDANAALNPGEYEIEYDGLDNDCDPGTADDDLDGDGYPVAADCNDLDDAINPGALEVAYDGVDNDCSGDSADDDLDGDGYGIADDCDDIHFDVNPSVVEVAYDGTDNDCDALTPDDDVDGDGFDLAGDCDDTNSEVSPDVAETPYDGVDNDCNSSTLDDDLDGDGYVLELDCDDANAAISPAETEAEYDGVDNDCDAATPDDDLDNDGFALANDCDDLNNAVAETCAPACVPDSSAVAGQVWDVADDFAGVNPNGEWSYGYTDTVGEFRSFAYFADYGDFSTWNAGSTLSAYHIDSVATWGNCGDYCYPGGGFGMHPDNSSLKAVARFTAPSDGQYQFDVSFTPADAQVSNIEVWVVDPAGILLNDFLTYLGDTASLNGEVLMLAGGDTVDFIVGYGSNYAYYDDGTRIEASIIGLTAGEIAYDGIDNDCDASTPDDDLDGDGFVGADDCDDTDGAVNPAAVEVEYDGVDNDCNPSTLDDDIDGDGFDLADDCDDDNADVSPGAIEIISNGVDDDCDATTSDTPPPPSTNATDAFNYHVQTAPWSYGYTDVLGGFVQYHIKGWSAGIGCCLSVYQIPEGPVYGNCGDYCYPGGALGMHPDNSPLKSIVRYTALIAGDYDIAATMTAADAQTYSRSIQVWVLNGSTPLLDDYLDFGYDTSSYSGRVTLSVGETVDFVVGYGADRVYYNDGIFLDATVTGPY